MFKVGDKIIGNEDNNYCITGRGIECIVVEVYDGYDFAEEDYGDDEPTDRDCIRVKVINDDRCYWVNPKFFDLINKKINNLDWR